MSHACPSTPEGGEGPPKKCSAPVHGAQSTETSLTHMSMWQHLHWWRTEEAEV